MTRMVSEKENPSPKADVRDSEVGMRKPAHAEIVETETASLNDKSARRTRRGEEPEHESNDLDVLLKKQCAEKKLSGEAAKVFTFTEDKLNDTYLTEGDFVRALAYMLVVEGPKCPADDAKADLACDFYKEPSTNTPIYVMSDWIAERVPLASIGPNLVPAVFDDDSEDEDSEDDFDNEDGGSEDDCGHEQ